MPDTTRITAEYDEKAIARALIRAGVDFNELVEQDYAVDASIRQSGEGPVYFEVTIRTYAVKEEDAKKILSEALL